MQFLTPEDGTGADSVSQDQAGMELMFSACA